MKDSTTGIKLKYIPHLKKKKKLVLEHFIEKKASSSIPYFTTVRTYFSPQLKYATP